MIVNPNAGKKKGLRVAETSTAFLEKNGISVKSMISEKAGDSVHLAAELDTAELDGLIAVGGDGTLFEVINGLLKNGSAPPLLLGQIPVGTGNSFIRDLGIFNAEDAIQAILSRKTRSIDLGQFVHSDGTHYFINLLGTGFVSNVAYRAKKYKKLGPLSYILGVIEEVLVLKAVDIELVIDGIELRRKSIFVEICNSRYTGGDMCMAPTAEIDDELLDIIVLNKISRLKLLSLFPSIFRGDHVKDEAVEMFRGRTISIKSEKAMALTPDGETFGATPIDVKIHPGKVKMFCG